MGMAIGDDEDLDFKLGDEQVDRLFLGTAFVWPMSSIVNFQASDDRVEEIQFTWTDSSEIAPNSYDLYENGIRIYDNIVDGQILPASVGVSEFYIKALYGGGQGIDSNKDSGESLLGEVPGTIVDFYASQDQIERVQSWWSDATGSPTPTYSIYVNGNVWADDVLNGHTLLLPPDSYDMHIQARNSQGNTDSNHAIGISTTETPSYIDDFSATDNQVMMITVYFSNATGPGPIHYDLYQDDILIHSNISSGFYDQATPNRTVTFYVHAINSFGFTKSNSDTGYAYQGVTVTEELEVFIGTPEEIAAEKLLRSSETQAETYARMQLIYKDE